MVGGVDPSDPGWPNIGGWFGELITLIDNLYNWLIGILQSVLLAIKDIASSLKDLPSLIFNFFKGILDIILAKIIDIFNALKDIPELIWNSFKTVLSDIVQKIISIIDVVTSIPGFIGDIIGDLLELLFIPKRNPADRFADIINSKFPFVSQVIDLVATFIFVSGEVPAFVISWQGKTVSIVDFNSFRPYIGIIHLIIIGLAYYRFFHRLYNKIPSIIGGFHT